MKFKRWCATSLSLVFFATGCASKNYISSSDRVPAGAVCNHAAHNPLGLDAMAPKNPKVRVGRYKGLLKAPPVRFLATVVAQAGLSIYIKSLPLKEDVEKRVLQNLNSKKFSKDLVPFLLATMDLYKAGKKVSKNNFKNYILDNFEKDSYDGLEHDLFTFKTEKELKKEAKKLAKEEKKAAKNKSEEVEKDKSETAHMIASVITILDALILMDPNFNLNEPPKRSSEIVDRVTPHVETILTSVLAGMEPGGDTYEAVHAIATNPLRVKAATASLIDAVHIYAYKHYNMFSKRYLHKEKMKTWFENASEEEVVKYFEESKNKKYAFHVQVDGLQGTMMESLIKGDVNSPFLKLIQWEQENYTSYKPKSIEVGELADPKMNFFNQAMSETKPFKDEKYLPFFKKLYGNYYNSIAKQGVSTTPTISVRNIPIIQTGATVAGQGGTGLPNFHFVDREDDRPYYFFGNDAILLEELTKKSGMKTIAERFPSLNTLNCGSTYESGFDWSFDPMLNLILGEKTRDFGEVLCLDELENRLKNEKKVKKLRERYLKFVDKDKDAPKRRKRILEKIAMLENETLPEYVSYYNPWPDHFAHFKGPMSDEIISTTGELNRLDFWLGKFTSFYKKAEIYEKTFFAMAGDHGLAPVKYVLNPEKIVFGELEKLGYQIKLNKISSDEGEGPKLSDHVNPPSQKEFDVVVASTAGGNHMMDFFKEDPSRYKEQPVYSDLIDYKLKSGQRLNLMDEIVNRLGETLDYMVVRLEPSTLDRSKTLVQTKRTGDLQTAEITRRKNKIFYKSESDLLEVKKDNPFSAYAQKENDDITKSELIKKCLEDAVEDNIETWCDEDDWRDLTAFTSRPDSIVQLSRLYDTPLAGTVNVFPARYIGYNSKVPGRHAGELFEEKDAFVAYWGNVNPAKDKLISEINGSVPVTVIEYLGNKIPQVGKDGIGFRSLFERARKKK